MSPNCGQGQGRKLRIDRISGYVHLGIEPRPIWIALASRCEKSVTAQHANEKPAELSITQKQAAKWVHTASHERWFRGTSLLSRLAKGGILAIYALRSMLATSMVRN